MTKKARVNKIEIIGKTIGKETAVVGFFSVSLILISEA